MTIFLMQSKSRSMIWMFFFFFFFFVVVVLTGMQSGVRAFSLVQNTRQPLTTTTTRQLSMTVRFATDDDDDVTDGSLIGSIDDSNYISLLRGTKMMNQPLLVDAYTTWCGPCKLIEPTLIKCAHEWKDCGLQVVKYNVESNQSHQFKLELTLQGYLPRSLPCLILFVQEQAVAKLDGACTYDQLEQFLYDNWPLSTATTTRTKLQQQQQSSSSWKQQQQDKKHNVGLISFAGMSGRDDYMLSAE